VQRFGQQCPEIPAVVGAAEAGARVALDRVVEVGEAQRIAEEGLPTLLKIFVRVKRVMSCVTVKVP
jgi:hypothetical protein